MSSRRLSSPCPIVPSPTLWCVFFVCQATACRVLKLVLGNGEDAHVSCSVKSEALELLQGRLRGASVTGRGWASRLGLTARWDGKCLQTTRSWLVSPVHQRLVKKRQKKIIPPASSGWPSSFAVYCHLPCSEKKRKKSCSLAN